MKNSTQQQKVLEDLGLTDSQALVYTALLESGLSLGKHIVNKTSLKKGLVYKVLDQLIELSLVGRKDRGNRASLFYPLHPSELQKFADEKIKEAENVKQTLETSIGKMVSMYNLLAGKPNVQMYEGKEGVRKVVFDSTNAKTEVLTIADNEAMNKYYPEINEENKKRRQKNTVFKKILSVDSKYIRNLAKNDNRESTERKLLKDIPSLETVMQIYDNKISYITLDPDRAIAVIIEDKALADTQRHLFTLLWKQAESAYPSSQ